MFKEIGQIAGLMKNLPKIKEEMAKLQHKLGQITADGDTGASAGAASSDPVPAITGGASIRIFHCWPVTFLSASSARLTLLGSLQYSRAAL